MIKVTGLRFLLALLIAAVILIFPTAVIASVDGGGNAENADSVPVGIASLGDADQVAPDAGVAANGGTDLCGADINSDDSGGNFIVETSSGDTDTGGTGISNTDNSINTSGKCVADNDFDAASADDVGSEAENEVPIDNSAAQNYANTADAAVDTAKVKNYGKNSNESDVIASSEKSDVETPTADNLAIETEEITADQDFNSSDVEGDVDGPDAGKGEPDANNPDAGNTTSSDNKSDYGQTYTTQLTPDVVLGIDTNTAFSLTIEEVGNTDIAEAVIQGNDLTFVSLDSVSSTDGVWDGSIDFVNNVLYLLGSALQAGQSVTAEFTATTPDTAGIHILEVDVIDSNGISNSPQAAGLDDQPSVWVAGANCDVHPGESIQTAIDNANSYDIINVHAGTYNENLLIEKPLALTGTEGSSHTTIFANDPDNEILLVQGEADNLLADVIVRGLTFSGEHITPDGTWINGIRFRHVEGGTFEDIKVTKIGGPDANEVAGVSIIGGGNNTFTNVTVDEMEGLNFNWGFRLSGTINNTFNSIAVQNLTDPHSTLLHTTGVYMTSNSDGNLFTNSDFKSLSSSRTTHVIWVAESNANEFIDTKISGIHGDRQTSGVFIEHNSSVNKFINTTISDMTTSDPGLIVVGLHTQSTAGSGNRFIEGLISGLQGPNLARGFSLHAPETYFKNINIDFSEFMGAGITRAAQIALSGTGEIKGGLLAGADQGLFVSGSSINPAVTIEHVSFENNSAGILIENGNWAGDLSSLIVKNNTFKGNEYAINNMTADIFNARNNWWGDLSGPGTHPDDFAALGGYVLDPETTEPADGTGDAVSVNVLFDPWLLTPTPPPTPETTFTALPMSGQPIFPGLLPVEHVEPAIRSLIFGPLPVVTVQFVFTGTGMDLAKAIVVYEHHRQAFEENKNELDDRQYAEAIIELTAAQAAILVLETRLDTGTETLFNFDAVNEAYDKAVETFEKHGHHLNEIQINIITLILAASADVIAEIFS